MSESPPEPRPPFTPLRREPKLTELDEQILAAVGTTAEAPVTIGGRVGVSAHQAATRLRKLAARGHVQRVRPDDGPRNGPGSVAYRR